MTVLLPTLKIWRTSARPSITSTLLRLEQALEGRVDVVRELVDDVVGPDVDAFGLGRAAGGVRERVLNPTTIAFDADASRMSLSVMSPAPSWRMLIRTSSVESCSRACSMAPSEPDTSALRMIRSSLVWPVWIWR